MRFLMGKRYGSLGKMETARSPVLVRVPFVKPSAGPSAEELDYNESNYIFRSRAAGPPLGAVGQSDPIKGLVRAFPFSISEVAMEPYIAPPFGQPKAGPWPNGIYSHGGVTDVNWKKDATTRSHGSGSLLIRTPPIGGTDSAGAFQLPFIDDFLDAVNREKLYAGEGEVLHWQYRMRVNAAMLQPYAGTAQPSQWKVSIMGQGNREQGPPLYGDVNDVGGVASSCTPIETVNQSRTYNVVASNPGPGPYHSCGASPYGGAGFHGFGQADFGTHIAEQNAIGTDQASRCVYPEFSANCFSYLADVWYTMRFRIDIGNWGQPNSRIRMWVTLDGGATILVADSQVFVDQEFPADGGYKLAIPNTNYKYGKIWFLPYISGRDGGAEHITGEGLLWIDELIISKGAVAIQDPPFQSWPIVSAIRSMSRGDIRELTAIGDPVGPGSGWTADILSNYSEAGGVLTAWSGKMSWNAFHKIALFAGTGHNPAGNVMQLLRYNAKAHVWSKHDFTAPAGRGPWTHGYDMNASSWRDGIHYWDVSDGSVVLAERFNDPLGSPTSLSTMPDLPAAGGGSHLGNPQEWMPTIGTEGRLFHYNGSNGVVTFDPITSTWTTHHTRAAIDTLLGGSDFNNFNNYMWARYSQAKDAILFGGGADSNKIVRFSPDGSATRVGAIGNPFASIPSGTDCNVFVSYRTNELFVLDARSNQVWSLDLDTDVWTRQTALENIFSSLDDVSPPAVGTVWGKLSCCLYEFGAVLFLGGSVSNAKLWLWKPV